MKTKIITLTIELPMDSQQANNWVNENDFIESTVKEIFNEKIKNNLTNHSGSLETDDEIGSYILSVSENKDKWIEIKTKEDLPNEYNDVEFFVVINGVVSTRVFYNGKFVNDYQLNIEEYDDLPTQPTHYQKIVMPDFPQS